MKTACPFRLSFPPIKIGPDMCTNRCPLCLCWSYMCPCLRVYHTFLCWWHLVIHQSSFLHLSHVPFSTCSINMPTAKLCPALVNEVNHFAKLFHSERIHSHTIHGVEVWRPIRCTLTKCFTTVNTGPAHNSLSNLECLNKHKNPYLDRNDSSCHLSYPKYV